MWDERIWLGKEQNNITIDFSKIKVASTKVNTCNLTMHLHMYKILQCPNKAVPQLHVHKFTAEMLTSEQ